MRRFAFSWLALFWLFTGITPATATEPAQPPLLLGVHPYLPVAEIQQRFTPLADYLGKKLGQPVQVRVGRDFEQHIDAVGLDQVDIAFIGPYAYVKMTARHGAKPLLARIEVKGKPFLSGYIVTRADSPLRNLTELRGKRFAFGDLDSTGTIVGRYVLQQAGVRLKDLGAYQYLAGHTDIALGVLNGDFDAGTIRSEVYDEQAARGLRALAPWPEVSEHLFVARAGLPAGQVKLLRQALLQLKDSPQGAAILQAIHISMTAMVPVADTSYDNMRKMWRVLDRKGE